MADLQRLCCRLLGSRGGISLADSLLKPPAPDPPNQNSNWCVCGNCRVMPTPSENKCCGCTRCATTFDDFHIICLEHSVLTVAIHNRADIYANLIDYSPASYRKAAYMYILKEHGYLGRGNRRIIPSCVVLCIRDRYPAPDGQYLGFKEY